MKNARPLVCLILALSLLTACTASPTGGGGGGDTHTGQTAPTVSADVLADPVDDGRIAAGEFSLWASGGDRIRGENGIYTVTEAGEYVLSGALEEGRVVVDAGTEDQVTLVLQNVSLSSSDAAPILALQAGEVTVKTEEGSYNVVADRRQGDPEQAAEEDNQDAAIWAACDLKISGKGTLIVTSDYDNGIKSKDDLKVKNLTLKVTAPGCALKGNDSVTVQSGDLILISTGSDCIKTSNSGVSEKGNQRGTVTVEGGRLDIYAAQDGISAAYDAVITPTEEGCTVNIFTSSYADESGETASAGELYLIVPISLYSETDAYYARFYNGEEEGVWRECTYDTMVYSGRSASYYGLKVKVPAGYQSLLFRQVAKGAAPNGEEYLAASDGEGINTSMNAYLITGIEGDRISGDWVQLSSGSGGSSDKTAFSSKGIKAANAVTVSGGNLTVYSMDDALHANGGETLENGAAGLGNVTLSGGSLTLTAADDGVHADGVLTLSGGTVNVVQAHEGLEGNVIRISGGSVFVCAEDDGLNACRGDQTPLIEMTGGYLDVTTPSGDTDAIDSNGSFAMSGGFALIKGGAATGNMAGSVDVDGTVTVTGGSIVALGGICELPDSGSVNVYASSGSAFGPGTYQLTDGEGTELLTFSLAGSYSSCWIASDVLELNGSYTVWKDGDALLEWTQSSSLAGNYSGGMGGGGMGGPGGHGGGMGGPGGRR